MWDLRAGRSVKMFRAGTLDLNDVAFFPSGDAFGALPATIRPPFLMIPSFLSQFLSLSYFFSLSHLPSRPFLSLRCSFPPFVVLKGCACDDSYVRLFDLRADQEVQSYVDNLQSGATCLDFSKRQEGGNKRKRNESKG
jgi:hypothetical protein